MTMRRHLRTTLCGLAALLGLMSVLDESSTMADEKPTTLIPGYVDADGTVHPEKLLSYVDALHRAADADVAEARIAQLQAHLSQVVATLSQTRDHLARQTRRAETAEQLAETRGKEITRLANLHQAGQAARASLRQADRSRLQSEVGELITSLQQSQTHGAQLSATLDRTQASLERTQASLASTTAERNASRQQVTQLTAANGKLDAELKSTRTQLADTTKLLDSTRSSLAATSEKLQASDAELAKSKKQLQVSEAARTQALADLKKLADKSKPVAVEPDKKSQDKKDPKDDADEKAKPADKPKAAPKVESDDEGS